MNDLLRKFLFYLHSGKVTINGSMLFIPVELYKYFSVRANNEYEGKIQELLSRELHSGNTFIDIGANLGILSLHASRIVGDRGKVFCFEPNPFIFNQLVWILNRNLNLRNYYCHQSAVNDRNGIVKLLIDRSSVLMEDSGFIKNNENQEESDVLCHTLDNFFEPGIVKPDIIKIDVEGAELKVLRGANRIIAEAKPRIIVEIHGLYFEDPATHVKKIFDFFEFMNYGCFNILKNSTENQNSFMKDGGIEIFDRLRNQMSRKSGYGNLLFYPQN